MAGIQQINHYKVPGKVRVAAGSFERGSTRFHYTGPLSRVTISHDLYVKAHDITNIERTHHFRDMAAREKVLALMETTPEGRRQVVGDRTKGIDGLFFGKTEGQLAARQREHAAYSSDRINVEVIRVIPDEDKLNSVIAANRKLLGQPAAYFIYDELVAMVNADITQLPDGRVLAGRLPTETELEFIMRTHENGTQLTEDQYPTASLALVQGGKRFADWGGRAPVDAGTDTWWVDERAPVDAGTYESHRKGLFGLVGGVWKYTDTWWADRYDETQKINPKGPKTGQYRVSRGGSFLDNEDNLLPFNRGQYDFCFRGTNIGGRAVSVVLPQDSLKME